MQELAKYVNTNAKTSAFYYISGPPYHDGSSIIELRKKYQSHVGRFPSSEGNKSATTGMKITECNRYTYKQFLFFCQGKEDAKSRKEKNASQCTFFFAPDFTCQEAN